MSIFLLKIAILVLAIVFLGRLSRKEVCNPEKEAVRVRADLEKTRINAAQ